MSFKEVPFEEGKSEKRFLLQIHRSACMCRRLLMQKGYHDLKPSNESLPSSCFAQVRDDAIGADLLD